jgi:hypothetical protein
VRLGADPTGLNLGSAEEEVDKGSKWWRKGNNHVYSAHSCIITKCQCNSYTWKRRSGSWMGKVIDSLFPLVLWFCMT